MSLRPTTALAARTTVVTSSSTQLIAMDTAEASECMRARRVLVRALAQVEMAKEQHARQAMGRAQWV